MAKIDDPSRERVTIVLGRPPTVRLLSLTPTRADLEDPDMQQEEGVTWIRGHHGEESAEGKALLAAFVLSRETPR